MWSKMLFNCNNCKYRPNSKEKEMYALFNEYLLDKYKFEYKESLFAIKPILMKSENDDSRPTIIKNIVIVLHLFPVYLVR